MKLKCIWVPTFNCKSTNPGYHLYAPMLRNAIFIPCIYMRVCAGAFIGGHDDSVKYIKSVQSPPEPQPKTSLRGATKAAPALKLDSNFKPKPPQEGEECGT